MNWEKNHTYAQYVIAKWENGTSGDIVKQKDIKAI